MTARLPAVCSACSRRRAPAVPRRRSTRFRSRPPRRPRPPRSHDIRWWHGAAAVGGLSALMLLDHPVQRFAQHNSGTGADNVAGVVRHFGQPEVYGTVTVGLLAAGLVTGRPRITRAGGRLAASLALAGLTVQAGKYALGRPAAGAEPRRRRLLAVLRPGVVALGTRRHGLRPRHLARRRHPPALGHGRALRDGDAPSAGRGSTTTATGSATWPPVPWWASPRPSSASGRWRIFGLAAPSVLAGPTGHGPGVVGRSSEPSRHPERSEGLPSSDAAGRELGGLVLGHGSLTAALPTRPIIFPAPRAWTSR